MSRVGYNVPETVGSPNGDEDMVHLMGVLPIRKISPSEVALTSYYSKLFVRRTSRAAFNYEKWLMDYIVSTGIDGGNDSITELKLNDVFDNHITLPREYTIISRRVSSFISKGYVFYFDKSNIESNFPNAKKSTSVFPVAKSVTDDTDIIYMDMKTGWIKVKESIMTLRGWVGLIFTVQENPELLPFRRSISLIDFIAVKF